MITALVQSGQFNLSAIANTVSPPSDLDISKLVPHSKSYGSIDLWPTSYRQCEHQAN
jgi:hypothetical protein